jgi:SAM-dependent methyltransferase
MDAKKAMVRDAYDAVADTWGRERERMLDAREHVWLERFCASLPGARVVDLGCGAGALFGRLIARGLSVVGVDFSRAQLRRARAMFPPVPLIEGDLSEIAFADASFDGAIVYDSLWHVPREEHAAVFKRIRRWIVDGAPLLFTVAALDPRDPDELLDAQLCGAPIYYSGWPRDTTFALLRAARFDVVAFDDTPERALLVLARAV